MSFLENCHNIALKKQCRILIFCFIVIKLENDLSSILGVAQNTTAPQKEAKLFFSIFEIVLP